MRALRRATPWIGLCCAALCGCLFRGAPGTPPPGPVERPRVEPAALLKALPYGREISFSDPAQWTVDAGASLVSTTDNLLAPPLCGRLAFSAGSGGTVTLRPCHEHPVRHSFNLISLYTLPLFAPGPEASVRLEYRDAQGRKRSVSDRIGAPGKWTGHLMRVAESEIAGAVVEAVVFTGLSGEPGAFLVDGLAFVQERLQRPPPAARPGRVIAPVKGQSAGYNLGKGALPFPSGPEGMRPHAARAGGWNEMAEDARGFRFRHVSEAGTLSFNLPRSGPFASLAVEWNQREVLRPLESFSGAIRAEDRVETRRNGDRVWMRGDNGSEAWFSITGRVMRIDIAAPAGISGIGWDRLPAGVTPLELPLLNAGVDQAFPLWMPGPEGEEKGLFAWAGFDLPRSNGVRMETSGGVSRMLYAPTGHAPARPVFETLWIAVSPDPLEVLPGVPTLPPPEHLQAWRTNWIGAPAASGPPSGAAGHPARLHPLKGLETVLGVSPIAPEWDSSRLLVGGDGQFLRDPTGGHLVKPVLALEEKNPAIFRSAPRREDVWRLVDHDERCPGALSFVQTWLLLGEWLLAGRGTPDSPVVCAGEPGWLLSGVATHGFCETPVARLVPFLPLATHARLNASSVLFAPGREQLAGFQVPAGCDAVDVLTATAIAYGMAARAEPADPADPVENARRVALLSRIQNRFCAEPSRISFHDGERLVSLPRALRQGVWRQSRIYLQLPCGLELWVNGSAQDWTVRQGRDEWVLPPFGHVAIGGAFRQMSVRNGGGRVEYVEDGEFRFLSPRGEGAGRFAGARCDAAIQLHRVVSDDGDLIELLWPGAASACDLPAGWLAGAAAPVPADGQEITPALDGLTVRVKPAPGARVVRWKAQPGPRS